MHRTLILFFLLGAPLAWAQESEESDTAAPEAAEPTDDTAAETDAELEGLDEPYPIEDEDVFIPSEDVAFGQSIPFPTDI